MFYRSKRGNNSYDVPWYYTKGGKRSYNRGHLLYAKRQKELAEKNKAKKTKKTPGSPQPSTSKEQPEEPEKTLEDYITELEINSIFANFSDNYFDEEPETPDLTPMDAQEQPQNDAPRSVGATSNGTSNTASSAMGSTINKINYVINPYMSLNKTQMFTRSRILKTWGNANFFKEGSGDQIKKEFVVPLCWLPVEVLSFYISQAEYIALPLGSKVIRVKYQVTPLGTACCFNTNTANSAWTNSTQTIFGFHTLGLNKTGYCKPVKITERQPDKPMIIKSVGDVKPDDLSARWYGDEKLSKTNYGSAHGIIRSVPWYTQVAVPDQNTFNSYNGTWDLSRHLTQWEFHSHINVPIIDVDFNCTNGWIKQKNYAYNIHSGTVNLANNYQNATQFVHAKDTSNTFYTKNYLLQSGTLNMKPLTNDYNTLVNLPYLSKNNITTTAESLPSCNFGVMAVQSNAPDDGLQLTPDFVNVAAYFKVSTLIEFDIHLNTSATHSGDTEHISHIYSGIEYPPEQYYNQYHINGYPVMKKN